MDNKKPDNVHGNLFLSVRFLIKSEKKKGIKICDINTTHTIPIIEIMAIDLNAGCFANIKTPSPAMVVMADKKIDDLKEERFFFPVLYSCNKPSMMNIL